MGASGSCRSFPKETRLNRVFVGARTTWNRPGFSRRLADQCPASGAETCAAFPLEGVCSDPSKAQGQRRAGGLPVEEGTGVRLAVENAKPRHLCGQAVIPATRHRAPNDDNADQIIRAICANAEQVSDRRSVVAMMVRDERSRIRKIDALMAETAHSLTPNPNRTAAMMAQRIAEQPTTAASVRRGDHLSGRR